MGVFAVISYEKAVNDPAAFEKDIQSALLARGFFYLNDIEHIYPDWKQQWDDAFSATEAFFELPIEEKQAIQMENSKHFRGYTAFGVEVTAGKKDLREQIDLAPESPAFDNPDPIQLSLYGPNQYPSQVPSFEPAISKYRDTCDAISKQLITRIAHSLTPHPHLFERIFEVTDPNIPNYSRMKVVRYPPTDKPNDNFGVGKHKDGGGLTLLAVDSPGLQAQLFDGQWADIDPVPYALVINIGQCIEQISAGTYPAATHRVLPITGSTPRLSIPFFFCPSLTTQMRPLEPSQLHPELQKAALEREEISEVPKFDLHEDVFGKAAWRGITRSHENVWCKYYGPSVDSIGGPVAVA